MTIGARAQAVYQVDIAWTDKASFKHEKRPIHMISKMMQQQNSQAA